MAINGGVSGSSSLSPVLSQLTNAITTRKIIATTKAPLTEPKSVNCTYIISRKNQNQEVSTIISPKVTGQEIGFERGSQLPKVT